MKPNSFFGNKLLTLQIKTKQMRKTGNMTAYRESLRQKILHTAMSLFKKKGIKAVRMDDIATEMGISKRTLYEIYSNKEDLLYECVRNENETMMKTVADYAKNAENEMAVLAFFFFLRLKDLGSINPLFFTEMEKYERILQFFRANSAEQTARSQEFMRKGVEHGFFRDDLNYAIMDCMGEAAMNHVMRTRLYEKYKLNEIFHTFVIVFMRGCCTEKGLAYLDKFVEEH